MPLQRPRENDGLHLVGTGHKKNKIKKYAYSRSGTIDRHQARVKRQSSVFLIDIPTELHMRIKCRDF